MKIFYRCPFVVAFFLVVGGPVAEGGGRERIGQATKSVDSLALCQRGLELSARALGVDVRNVAKRMQDFGLREHLKLVARRPGEGTCFSPFAVMNGFLGLTQGSFNLTFEQLKQGLGFSPDITPPKLRAASRRIRGELSGQFADYGMALRSGYFFDAKLKPLPFFLIDVENDFGVSTFPTPFGASPLAAAREIDDFFKDAHAASASPARVTALPAKTKLLLAGRGSLRIRWALGFPPSETVREEFRTEDSTAMVEVPMMYLRNQNFLYFRGQGFQMVSIPLLGGEFVLDLLVPDFTSPRQTAGQALQGLSKQFTGDNYRLWIKNLRPQRLGKLGMPRWKTETGRVDLSSQFFTTFPSAFDPRAADFSGAFAEGRFAVDRVIYQGGVEVDETGVEIISTPEFSAETSEAEVVADHPFHYVVRHLGTGVPVMVGTEFNPK